MDDLNLLQSLGFTMPSPAYLAGVIIFGILGYAAYRYGKRKSLTKAKWIGVALMLYPYAVSETWLIYAIGIALCIALYAYRQ